MFATVYSLLLATSLATCQPKVPEQTGSVADTVSQSIQETTVFQNGEGGYLCYRIPAIVKAPNGTLLAFAEGRRTDCGDFGDVDIVLRVSKDNGQSWGPIKAVVDFGNLQAGNAAPVFDLTDPRFSAGRLFLLYNTGMASEADVRKGLAVREVWYKTSTDGGQSWSEPVNITTQVSRPNKPDVNPHYTFKDDWRSYANTPGHALQLQKGRYKGRIFVAANHSEGQPQPQFRDYRAHGFYSDDHGKTWKLSPTIPYPGGNESTAAETVNGSLLFNARNQSGDVKNRLLAFSANAGESWESVFVAPDLPDPICQGSMINYQPRSGSSVLLFSNDNSQTSRTNLTVRVSRNDGKSWSAGKSIYAGSSAYSDLVIEQDGTLGVLYEKDTYTKITYARFQYDWLIN